MNVSVLHYPIRRRFPQLIRDPPSIFSTVSFFYGLGMLAPRPTLPLFLGFGPARNQQPGSRMSYITFNYNYNSETVEHDGLFARMRNEVIGIKQQLQQRYCDLRIFRNLLICCFIEAKSSFVESCNDNTYIFLRTIFMTY
jgi:hypothetical protein